MNDALSLMSSYDWFLAGSIAMVLLLAAWVLLRMGRHLRMIRENERLDELRRQTAPMGKRK